MIHKCASLVIALHEDFNIFQKNCKQRRIDRCGPRGPKQQPPRGLQRRCNLAAAPFQMKTAYDYTSPPLDIN